jgi:hypothetical protein
MLIDIPLNTSALLAISLGSRFGLGGQVMTLSVPRAGNEIVFGGSYGYSTRLAITTVPEPATVALLGLGLVGVAALRRPRLS